MDANLITIADFGLLKNNFENNILIFVAESDAHVERLKNLGLNCHKFLIKPLSTKNFCPLFKQLYYKNNQTKVVMAKEEQLRLILLEKQMKMLNVQVEVCKHGQDLL